MKRLSIQAINDSSSYEVSELSQGCYQLNWRSDNAAQVGELLDRLKNGRTFRGGDKTGLVKYYKGWKEKLHK